MGVSFQNKAFCDVFLMYSLIKCSIFSIYASNLFESIKILYKFNNLVAYFCQHRCLQYIVLFFFFVCCFLFVCFLVFVFCCFYFFGIAILTGTFWGMPKIVVIFFFFFFWLKIRPERPEGSPCSRQKCEYPPPHPPWGY